MAGLAVGRVRLSEAVIVVGAGRICGRAPLPGTVAMRSILAFPVMDGPRIHR